jgi:hypothetical protein
MLFVTFGWQGRLFHADDLAVVIDHDLESQHAQVGPSVLGQAGLDDAVHLFVHVLQLVLDEGVREQVIAADHLDGLFGDGLFVIFDLSEQGIQYLPVNFFRRDVAKETIVIDDVGRFVSNVGNAQLLVILVEDQSFEHCFGINSRFHHFSGILMRIRIKMS